MSVSRPLARLLRQSRLPQPAVSRPFSTTPINPFPRRRPSPKDHLNKVTSISATSSAATPSVTTSSYTPAEVEELKQHYSPEQLNALLAGEAAISKTDFDTQKRTRRTDAFNLGYLDDLSHYDGILDFPQKDGPRKYRSKVVDPKNRLSEFEIPEQPLPKIEDPGMTYDDNAEGSITEAAQKYGWTERQIKNLRVKPLVFHGVSNQTRMGKIRKFYCLVAAGNGHGLIGIGEGKAVEMDDARDKARDRAIKNLQPIPRYENRTIYGDVEIKRGAVEMKLMTRPPGFGVRCSSYIYELCQCVGIKDLSAKVTRSRNPMNVIKTFLEALKGQKLPDTIARGRGKKLVDVRKVYYGAQQEYRREYR